MPYSSQIQIVNDANGIAHAFLADNGLVWECQWNAEAQRWDQGQVVPGAYGARDLQALVVDDLWPSSGSSGAVPGNAQGIVLAYRLGSGASSQVVASFGAWSSDGSLKWSEAVPLSNTQGDDEAFALVPSAVGTLKVVLQKREPTASPQELLAQFSQNPSELLSKQLDALASGARSDSDLYVSNLQINASDNGGYAVQLSGNGTSESTALTPAALAPPRATAAPAFGGNTQLSRAALAANAAPSAPNSPVLLGALGASAGEAEPVPVPFDPPSEGAGPLQGFGFTNYKKRPATAASLGLFPTRYFLSSGLTKYQRNYAFITEEESFIDVQYFTGTPKTNRRSSILAESVKSQESVKTTDRVSKRSVSVISEKSVIEEDLIGNQLIKKDSANSFSDFFTVIKDGFNDFLGNNNEASQTDGNPAEALWSGVYGGLLAGRGGYTVINFSTLQWGKLGRNGDKRGLDESSTVSKANHKQYKGTNTNLGVVIAGGLKTIFQYAKPTSYANATTMTGFAAQESVGLNVIFYRNSLKDTGARTVIEASVAGSYLLEQRYSSDTGLSAALAYVGLGAGAFGNLIQQRGSASLLERTRKGTLGSGYKGADSAAYNGLLGPNNPAYFANAVGFASMGLAIGGAVGVAYSKMEPFGKSSDGIGIQEALKVRVLSKYGLGIGLYAGSQENFLWTYRNGAGKGPDWQILSYATVGLSLDFGGFVPLLTTSWVHNSPSPVEPAAPGSSELPAAPQPSFSQGSYTAAPTGANYPFGYAPATATDALLTAISGPLATLTSTAASLVWHQLTSFSASQLKAGLLSWKNLGTGLNDGLYTNVAVIGLSLPASAAATASFQVVNGAIDPTTLVVQGARSLSLPGWINGDLLTLVAVSDPALQKGDTVTAAGLAVPLQISGVSTAYDAATQTVSYKLSQAATVGAATDPQSIQISTAQGQYLSLPEPSSGRYALALDVFQQQPGNPAAPSAAGAISVLSDLPLFSLETNIGANGSPLLSRAIQRIQTEIPLTSLSDNSGSYPKLDGSAPAANDYSPYSYYNVPVAVLSNDGSGSPIQLLNPAVKATVKFSGGAIVAANLNQPIYFSKPSPTATSGSYALVLDLAASLGSSSSVVKPTFVVNSQVQALNDFSDQQAFSANPTARNAGVYLAAGLSDQLALLPSYGRFPVQNRVAYVNGDTIVYLNNTGGSSGGWKPVYSSNFSLEDLYNKPNDFHFTAASDPTGITDTASNTTYVFWVEASEPVIPITSGNGEANYQAFMNALYGHQRINYSYATVSASGTNTTWNYVNAADLYASAGNIITDLRSFSVQVDGAPRTLLVWTEVAISALKTAETNPDALFDSQLAVIKVGLINPRASQNLGGYQWKQLFSDANGNSTIATIPWDDARGSGLSIADLSAATLPVQLEPVARFSGFISDTTLKVSQLSAGSLETGDLILGAGVLAGTTVTAVITAATASSAGTYRVSVSHTVASTNLAAVPLSGAAASTTPFAASFSGAGNTTLTVAAGLSAGLQVGDQLVGVGLEPGTFITAVQAFDAVSGSGRFTINRGPASATGSYALLALPAGTPSPDTSETLLTPVLSWAETVRTPYNQAVLQSEPVLFLPFGALQSGFNSLNIGASGNNTETFASDTGLNTSIAGALPKSNASAVQNVEGLGVLATGLGTFNSQTLELLRNTPQTPTNPADSPVAIFSGTVSGTTLSVTSLSQGSLELGELLVGAGVTAGTTITAVITAATATTAGVYTLSASSTLASATTLRTLPSTQSFPLVSFNGSFSGTGGANGYTTLTIADLAGPLQVGDRVYGLGLAGGTTIEQVQSLDLNSGTAVVTVSQGPESAGGSYGLAASAGGSSSPYTIEFWTKLGADSNPAGAGLVALGQPSGGALPDRPLALPEGWLLSSSFAVVKLSWQDALQQSLEISLPEGIQATDLYGYTWALQADGANTRAMNGNGGSNLYRNALLLDNLLVGDTIDGVNNFLANYGLSSSDLPGLDGTTADQIAASPSTAFQFSTDLNFNAAVGQPVASTSLNGVAIDTSTAVMNAGLVLASQAEANANLGAMLESLWNFEQKTGGPKVLFSLDPTNQTQPPISKPPITRIEQYGGYALNFAVGFGPAVSVNGKGQIAFDVAVGQTLFSNPADDYRDDSWHYVAASFLPDYITYSADGNLLDLPRNVGTASLYIDGKLVSSQANVVDPLAPNNNNDYAQLLSDNSGGALDLLALYNTALTTIQPPAIASDWPLPTSKDALALMKEVGFVVASETPHPGEQPGAVSNHYLAHTVDPNNAVKNTFTSVLLPDASGGLSWSQASTLNPLLATTATTPSASNGSVQQELLIAINADDWAIRGWYNNSSSTAAVFNPAGKTLQALTVTLTPEAGGNVIIRTLTPEQVLLGSKELNSLASLQPQAQDQDFHYTFLSNAPALNLLISRQPQDSTDQYSLDPRAVYSASVKLQFADGSSVSNTSANSSTVVPLGFGTSLASSLKTDGLANSKALATAAVLEEAPLQLKYVNSGVQLSSQNSPSDPSPASSFGSSQVYGYYANGNGTQSGWLAISQPSSANAVSDPAGRIWLQAAGQFSINSANQHIAVSDPAQAPITWLNALAASNFSPSRPNLPLLNSALYQSSVGGLLIKADASAGWGQNFGATMLVADVNNDGTQDLIISAPQANGGGAVVVVDGRWIAGSLNSNTGQTILDLSNPANLGAYVTVLRPGNANSATDITTVAGFGSALAFQSGSNGKPGTIWIGAPNYLRSLDANNAEDSTQPIGALYAYNTGTYPGSWGTATPTILSNPWLGSGGSLTTLQAGNTTSKTWWGAQLGTAVASSSDGQLAVSAPGVTGGIIYSGTEKAVEVYGKGNINFKSTVPDGLLSRLQVGGTAIDTTGDVDSAAYTTISSLQADQLSDQQLAFLKKLGAAQLSQIAQATTLNNQAIQSAAVGAVMLFNSGTDFSGLANTTLTPAAVAQLNGNVYYGANPYNTLGDTGFGSSVAFADLTNSNIDQLIVGADKVGGGGAVFTFDPDATYRDKSLGLNQHLAILAATNLFMAAAAADYLGSGLVSLGDVNNDGYGDVLLQAYNADSSAGNGYVLFGGEQLSTTNTNQGLASLASGSIGSIDYADGTQSSIAILSELGSGGGLTGQGSYGPGDVNADGLNDILLGSGPKAKGYLTWGHTYLESISNLQLERLTSNNGFLLEGLATTTQGSLRSIGDFNGDGYGDFISINPGSLLTTVRIELGANTQEILADAPYSYYSFTVANGTEVLAAGDINGDGLSDISLFLDQNLSTAEQGNRGAGSSTGILYGRNSTDLPLGSGFGFLTPVDPTSSAPLAPLPGLLVEGSDGLQGLTDATPSVIAVGSTLYAAVKGANDNTLWFSQSNDGGNSWANWSELSTLGNAFSTSTGPSLAYFNEKLYLGFVNSAGTLSLSSWDPSSNNPLLWSTPSILSTTSGDAAAFSSASGLQLVDRGDSLGVVWMQGGSVYGSSSTEPVTPLGSTAPWAVVNGGASQGTPALVRDGASVYMAVQGGPGNNSIYWTASSDGGATWKNWQALPGSMTTSKPPSLAVVNGSLYLSYLGVSNNLINITSLSNAATNSWSSAYQIPGQSAKYASLTAENVGGTSQLAVYYVSNDPSDRILKSYTSSPSSSSAWQPIQQIYYNYDPSNPSSGVQTASGPLAVSQYNGQTHIAYQGGTGSSPSNEIYVATSSNTNNGSTWSAQALLNPGGRTGLGLSGGDDGLLLSYSNASQPSELQLQLLTAQGSGLAASQSSSLILPASLSTNIAILGGEASGISNLLLAGINSAGSGNSVQTSLLYPAQDDSSWSTPLQLQQLQGSDTTAITATGTPSFTWLGSTPVLAVNEVGSIKVYTGLGGGSSLQLASSFTAPSGGPAIVSDPVITTTDTGLVLTYTNSDGSISLQRLNVLNANGSPVAGVQFNDNGSINVSQANLQWLSTTLNSGSSGLSTSLASTPVSLDGNLLLANVRNNTNPNQQIWINAVPNTSDPTSTTWLNSTVQLRDGSGGWSISQQAGSSAPTAVSASWAVLSGGQSPRPPALTEANGVLYAAVQGTDNRIYWNSSSNGGQSWSAWQLLPSSMSTNQAPALAMVNGTLYLAFVGIGNPQINITSLSGSNTWSPQYLIPNQTAKSICLVNENNNLALYYQGSNDNLYRTSTSNPSSSSSWQVNAIQYNNGSAPQTASGQLAVATLAGSTYLAYEGGTSSNQSNTIYLTSSANQGTASSWSLISGIPQASSSSHSGVGLASFGDSLLLSYADQVKGAPVLALQQGRVSNNIWSGIPYANLSSPGATTAPGASLITPNGSSQVLVASINGNSNPTLAISTTLAAAQPLDQLLTPGQTGSSLTPVGDLNNDGFADLLVSANNVVANTGAGRQLATGLRVISGAATSSAIASLNDSSATSQKIQLAAPFRPGSATPVAAITGSNPASGSLNLSIDSRTGSEVAAINAAVSPAALTATSSSVAEASSLLGGSNPTGQTLLSANGWGQQALNGNASYGDLNGDGYRDAFDPAGNSAISTIQGLSYSLWSIRPAGDVNGNGVDDVLLSLAPQGPAYGQITAGQPSNLQSVLVDGSLFKVDPTTNSFRLDQLRTPTPLDQQLRITLNPYNASQLYDVSSTSTSTYAPGLQNWFDPILSFIPGALTAASTANGFNPDSAASYSAPAVAVGDDGKPYMVYSGQSSDSKGAGLLMAYQDAQDIWKQVKLLDESGAPVGANASTLSPSAVFYQGKLAIAYTDIDHNLHIAWCEGSPQDSSARWKSYPVATTAAESSKWNPTLVVEQGRLAMYFPSNDPTDSKVNKDTAVGQAIRYLYSADPFNANPNWGGTQNSMGPGYAGTSGIVSIGGTQPIVSSPIAATTYQGRTVLAFRGIGGGLEPLPDAPILLLTQVASAATALDPTTSLSWIQTDTGQKGTNGVGLATDQALLYLTSTTYDNGTTTNAQPLIWSLTPKTGGSGMWSLGSKESVNGPGFPPNFYQKGTFNDNAQQPTVLNPFLLNGKLMAAWAGGYGSNIGDTFNVQLANLNTTITTPVQQSLAGYSLDGNIDINGDGFKDVLISDPSDPKQNVDNQYALFGGDYLNIASQVGTDGNDVILGTPITDVIYTIQGSDQVHSNGGADVIYTGAGDDQISIIDNAFIRIDAGSGFDVLRLEGKANQSYDFRLNVAAPQYFAGTKLRDIELVSSQDYGANTIYLDAAGVNAMNPDRILFLTPDSADSIILSPEFARNQALDTSYGGSLWHAYAAGPAVPSTSNPTLVYVLVPTGNVAASWLSEHVIVGGQGLATLQSSNQVPAANEPAVATGSTTEKSDPVLPTSSSVAGSSDFGEGLKLTAYRTNAGAAVASFSISRTDVSRSQIFSYISSTRNSSADPGPHYSPVIGLVRLAVGQAKADITVPIHAAIAALRNGSVSLEVAELDDLGQKQFHLLLEVDHASNGRPPTLSGLNLDFDPESQTVSIGFRADINKAARAVGLASTLNLNVLSRQSANSSTASLKNRVQKLALSEGILAKFDQDDSDNGQVELQLDLNASTGAIQLQAANLGLRPLVLSKLDPSRKPITLGIDLTTTSLDALSVANPPKGVVLNETAVDFTVKADADGKVKISLDLTQVGNDLDITETKDGAKTTRKANHQLLYYGIDGDGALSALTYNARSRTGARFYDIDGDSIADSVNLVFEDGGMGDTGPSGDGLIHDPSLGGVSNLTDVVWTAIDSLTLQAASRTNKEAPAALVVKVQLTSRSTSANQICYVVHDPSDSLSFDSIFADLNLLKARSQTLYTSLESKDVTLASSTSLSRDILLINGQLVRFFEVVDGTLNTLTRANDARLRVLSTTGFSGDSRSVNAFSSSGVSLSLALVDGDQGLNALIGQEQGLAPVLDFTSFTTDQKVEGSLSLAREAAFDAVTGFYRTLDIKGAVWRDPLDKSKGTITPGQTGTTAADYGAAALRNMVDSLTGMRVDNGQTSSRLITLQESTYLAPIAQVNGHTFVSFDKGNTDGISHFVTLGTSTFGLEDLHGGGDKDYDDQIISLVFSKLVNPVV